ncbi:zinc finger domain-containing protein [Terriglobus tenax]
MRSNRNHRATRSIHSLSFTNALWGCIVQCPTCGSRPGVWCWQDGPTANGKRVLIHEERKFAAGRLGEIGWHTFRHAYRSWLDEAGAPMKVQQELMRHASIQTAMNVYGQAMSNSKRMGRSSKWCSSL